MADYDFQPAQRPTFYFIGVTTGKSSIMKVFMALIPYTTVTILIMRYLILVMFIYLIVGAMTT